MIGSSLVCFNSVVYCLVKDKIVTQNSGFIKLIGDTRSQKELL